MYIDGRVCFLHFFEFMGPLKTHGSRLDEIISRLDICCNQSFNQCILTAVSPSKKVAENCDKLVSPLLWETPSEAPILINFGWFSRQSFLVKLGTLIFSGLPYILVYRN